MKPGARYLILTLLVASLAACSTSQTKPSRAAPTSSHSGFLQDYTLLQADPADPDYLHYVAPDAHVSQYRKFIIDDPVFALNTGDAYVSLDAAQVASFGDYYKSSMAAALARHYQVVSAPGPGVARLRVAVSGMVEVRPQLKARDLIPFKALFDAGRMAAGKSPYVLRMSFEAEATDSETGRLIGETVDSRESTSTVAGKSTEPSDEQVRDLVDYWVARFVARLDKANGFGP
ncbi:MAG TPA: DUF3313 domain-containing protein [Rhodanobacteraceae bacterium]|jgi:hypothetical protein|nr:DUF3313 domain-containing protein [Rhodanobacteraceae bacterium]